MIEVIGWLATALTAAQMIPQVVRTTRSGDTTGVSAGMFAMMIAQAGAWIGYGIREDLLPPIITNVVLATCGVLMLRLLIRNGAPRVTIAIGLVLVLLAAEAAIFAWSSTQVLGLVAAALAFVLLWPQVIVALRARDLSGLSALSWFVSVAGTVLWVIYGIGREAALLTLSAANGMVLSMVILGRMAIVRRLELAQPLVSSERPV